MITESKRGLIFQFRSLLIPGNPSIKNLRQFVLKNISGKVTITGG